jgi:hypothetical protein
VVEWPAVKYAVSLVNTESYSEGVFSTYFHGTVRRAGAAVKPAAKTAAMTDPFKRVTNKIEG